MLALLTVPSFARVSLPVSGGKAIPLMRFSDRREAGRLLAERLSGYAVRSDVVVLALPRGGVPVAFEVAGALRAPLDVFVVRKLGVPGHAELALGAVASGGVRVFNEKVVAAHGLHRQAVERIAERELAEVQRMERMYRDDRPNPELGGKVAIPPLPYGLTRSPSRL
jgi:putative phosphoribosyl transferase